MTTILVTGATGFIGRALVPALRVRGLPVVSGRRAGPPPRDLSGQTWRICDLLEPSTLPAALAGIDVAYYLVHSMGGGRRDFRQLETRAAENFAAEAGRAGVQRLIYLGGPQPQGTVSEHLRSRLEVGQILRDGRAPAVELRASMVVGNGGASWQIVRDLAVRLPAMVLPRWLRSRTQPIALDDLIGALVAAVTMPVAGSAWFDVPGPEVLSGRQILERIAAARGRRLLAIDVPVLSPRLSSLWLKLVTRTDFSLARELVDGLASDLLPADDRLWTLLGHPPLLSFDEAVARAFADEARVRAGVEALSLSR